MIKEEKMLNTIDKLNISYNGIFYNNKPMTETEQMHYLLSKLNLIIEHFNILEDTTREKIKELEETVNNLISITNDLKDEVVNNLKTDHNISLYREINLP